MSVYKIYIDGAARGNPGPAGAGILILDHNNKTISEISKYLGEATNNVAEYTAMVLAMDEARNLKAKDIVVNTDSQLLAKQLGGEYKVKNPALKQLHSKVNSLLASFDEVRINMIPREENKQADFLANKAIDNSGKKKKVGSSFILKSKKEN